MKKYLTTTGGCGHNGRFRLMRMRSDFSSGGLKWPLTVVMAGLALAISIGTVSGIPTSVMVNTKETNQGHHSPDQPELPVPVAVSASVHQSPSSSASFPVSDVVSAASAQGSERQNQISIPQKRGVNPLLYNDLVDYSGNSIPNGGVWDDLDVGGPMSSSSFRGGVEPSRLRNYDLLASLLAGPGPSSHQQQPQTFYNDPVAVPSAYGNLPYLFQPELSMVAGDRAKRMTSRPGGKNHLRSAMRLKRSPARMTAADALSLLALLESRDPYGSAALDLAPANGPNDVLPPPFSPNSVYQEDRELPLSVALAQLAGAVGRGATDDFSNSPLASLPAAAGTYGDEDGEWMNTWTEPAVDYLGFPLDVDTLSRLDGFGSGSASSGHPSKNSGYLQQKRFLMTKRKRSVEDETSTDCHNNKDCMLLKYGKPSTVKVSSA
ncbi:uncharacterized protein LOC129744586 [Uranotaenia lowii]|uniref:uncharacterized protein LOC129744586 n=1 Tax=Uranotaenia lowii TaxID=190385 RepID=UPI002478C22F|nr:uncharacterized protein LOC129744586 [Uranotaenia lowii]XP_055593175.1 uncharacterized protein LOC129744586 [Uranotaenia lowii]